MCRNQAAYRIILGWCKLNTYGGHGGSHVIGICDALIYHSAYGGSIDIGTVVAETQQDTSRTGDCPLRRRRRTFFLYLDPFLYSLMVTPYFALNCSAAQLMLLNPLSKIISETL